jgi:hypothetical protein
MFGLLRITRGFFGFLFISKTLQVTLAVATLMTSINGSVDIGKFFALLLIELVALGISAFLFFWLRGFINRLHAKKTGFPHPALAQKRWAL